MGEAVMVDELPLYLHRSPAESPMVTVVTIGGDCPNSDDITDEGENNITSVTSVKSLGRSGPRDEWLPITESRKGNEFYAAFHLICSGIGPQALLLPTAFAFLGWTWGIICLTLAFIWQLYTIWILVHLHEPVQGTRYSRYLHLSVASFGEKMGKIIALFPVMYLSGGTCVMLIITGGQTMELLHKTVAEDGGAKKLLSGTEWFLLFTCVAILIALAFPNLNSMFVLSLIGSVAAISYCTIIWILSGTKIRPNAISVTHNPSSFARSEMARISQALNGIGIIFLAFRGHNLILEIQGTLPSNLKKSSQKPMLKAVSASYLAIPACLVPLAVAGYRAYGDNLPDSGGMLKALLHFHGHEMSKAILSATCLLLVLSCLASFQLYAIPVFDNMEMRYTSIKNTKSPRFVKVFVRILFGGLTFFISVAFPFLPSLAGILGGITLPLTYAYPCFMWIAFKKPSSRFSPSWWFNIFLGGSGLVLSVLLAAAAVWSLVDQGLDANFFRPVGIY